MALEVLYFSLSFLFMVACLALFSFCYTRTYIWSKEERYAPFIAFAFAPWPRLSHVTQLLQHPLTVVLLAR